LISTPEGPSFRSSPPDEECALIRTPAPFFSSLAFLVLPFDQMLKLIVGVVT
jgi:hypothetical protein